MARHCVSIIFFFASECPAVYKDGDDLTAHHIQWRMAAKSDWKRNFFLYFLPPIVLQIRGVYPTFK